MPTGKTSKQWPPDQTGCRLQMLHCSLGLIRNKNNLLPRPCVMVFGLHFTLMATPANKKMQQTVQTGQTPSLVVGFGNDTLGGLFSTNNNKNLVRSSSNKTWPCPLQPIYKKNATNRAKSDTCSWPWPRHSWWSLLHQKSKKA